MKDQRKYDIFAARLKKAMARARYKTQKDLAETLELSEQVVSCYFQAKSMPDAFTLATISQKLGVSCDYLLGLSDAPTLDKDIAAASELTGLSVEAIETLKRLDDMQAPGNAKIINAIMQGISEEFEYQSAVLGYDQRSDREQFIDVAAGSLLGLVYSYIMAVNGDTELKTGTSFNGSGFTIGDLSNTTEVVFSVNGKSDTMSVKGFYLSLLRDQILSSIELLSEEAPKKGGA